MRDSSVMNCSDHVEVRGVSADQVEEALEIYAKVQVLRGAAATVTRRRLVQAMTSSGVSLVPPATIAQAERLAGHRNMLLGTPVYTHTSLQKTRGDDLVSTTRTWLSRRREAYEVFTLNHRGRALIPAFQLDAQGNPRPELQPILKSLIESGIRGWELWTWLSSPTSLLSGEVPEKLARTNSQRVLRAAQRFAANNQA